MPTTRANETRVGALSIGAAASTALSAAGATLRVHSVFRSTMNLEVRGSDTLVALTGPAGVSYAHAVVLDRDEDFRAWPHPVGSAGCIDGSFIRLHDRGNRRVVDLCRARRRPARVLPVVVGLGGAGRACVTGLSGFQADRGCDLLLRGLVSGAAAAPGATAAAATPMGEALRRSAAALGTAACGDGAPAEAVRRAVLSLVGQGTGLTPSGDDFLCGFLAAARCAAPLLAATLSAAIEVSIRSTGDISASLLRGALRGHWPVPLADLADALAADHAFDARRALGDLCGLGHSSGADIATGFLYGLHVLT